ncbi:RNA polymerase sigma factor [Dyadobacter sp. CY356]|uniref:RNA polymerase sigma factor n=1 Tax=Dyadobacter sp. CY356 TaxID=2906442 RepID=UPI001F306A31|nr:sigma-70 family RNA polymerase sigma factor [Dyadobacter sp. CY356]MCF0055141.1 sigma-70 family RNA polymerase sigma factor [Dyadobacter sp. CY356]
MAIRKLFNENEKSQKFLDLFQKGERKGMDYVYKNSFDSLLYFGKSLLNDEFIITCILHECYLKAWTNRARMESLAHIYRFIRMNVRWQILRHIEKSPKTTHGQTMLIDHFEKTIGDFEDFDANQESKEQESERIKAALEALNYLSLEAQNITTLYFKKGLSHKQIADRLGKSTFYVSNQIENSVNKIKNIINVSAGKQMISPGARQPQMPSAILNCQQSEIYALRKNDRLSFIDISKKLKIPVLQAQQQYIKAHQLLQNQSNPSKPF